MTLEQLIVFKEIAERGTLRAAATALGRTQPAISAALKQLENHLQFLLFSRKTYRPSLTAGGTRMLGSTRELLAAAQRWQEVADDLRAGSEPDLCISIDSATPLELVMPKIKQAVDLFPALRLDLQFGVVTQGLDDLLSGRAQLAIAPMLIPHEDIEYRPLLRRRLIACIHRRLVKNGQAITAADLRKIPNIVVPSGKAASPIGVPGLANGKSYHVSNHAVKEQMILLGLGWGRVPEDTLEHSPELMPIQLHELPTVEVEISVAWRRDATLGPAARYVREALSELNLLD